MRARLRILVMMLGLVSKWARGEGRESEAEATRRQQAKRRGDYARGCRRMYAGAWTPAQQSCRFWRNEEDGASADFVMVCSVEEQFSGICFCPWSRSWTRYADWCVNREWRRS
ncbi:hypothetical protein EDB80DRAFT_89667 [Ilyonectria destructans]|nr:hypothetical protein EDB80DRAFT_89667 [Ilyonectria destructans]